MVVKDGSVVELGGNILVGTFADSIGKLTISDNSIVRVLGGVLPIAWLTFPDPFSKTSTSYIGFSEGSEGEVILRDGSELSATRFLIGSGGSRGEVILRDGSEFSTTFLFIGSGGGRGELRAKDQSRVISRPYAELGRDETANGFATFRDGSSFHVLGSDDDGFGAFLNIGRGGRGELRFIESEFLIDGEDRNQASEGGFRLGRNPRSHGTLMLRDSTVTVRNMTEPYVEVGNGGFGSLVLEGNSTLVVENQDQDGTFLVATNRAGVSGEAVVSIGPDSLVDAGGRLLLCLEFDGETEAGMAEINVQGILRAAEIRVGPGCTIDGNGTIEGDVINLGGSISEGITIVP